MKLLNLIILLMVILTIFLTSCEIEDIPPIVEEEELSLPDKEILQEFPDDLDDALEELETIE